MSETPPPIRPAQPPKKREPSALRDLAGSDELRPPLNLTELLEILVHEGLLTEAQGADIESRTMTLRSQVLKDRVGSVRSQAAARYDVSAAEIITASAMPNAKRERRLIDEDCIAECIAESAMYPYKKLDPLKLDNKLITNTLSRAFAHRHVVVPVSREANHLTLAVTDPFDSTLQESLSSMLDRIDLRRQCKARRARDHRARSADARGHRVSRSGASGRRRGVR